MLIVKQALLDVWHNGTHLCQQHRRAVEQCNDAPVQSALPTWCQQWLPKALQGRHNAQYRAASPLVLHKAMQMFEVADTHDVSQHVMPFGQISELSLCSLACETKWNSSLGST